MISKHELQMALAEGCLYRAVVVAKQQSTSGGQEVMGSNPAGFWAVFSSPSFNSVKCPSKGPSKRCSSRDLLTRKDA